MSSSRSNSSSYSNVSANNLYEVEDELKGSEKSDDEDNANSDNDNMDDNSDIEAYFDEPMADEAWLADYLRRREEDEERQQQLQLRLNRNEPVTSW